jgi:hypothetical protein
LHLILEAGVVTLDLSMIGVQDTNFFVGADRKGGMKKYFVSMILVILVASVLGTNNVVLAKSAYQSGYEHGIHDAKNSGNWYILQPGKGFEFHSKEFVRGYVTGYCSIEE